MGPVLIVIGILGLQLLEGKSGSSTRTVEKGIVCIDEEICKACD